MKSRRKGEAERFGSERGTEGGRMEQMPGVRDTHHCVMEAAFSWGPVTKPHRPPIHKPPSVPDASGDASERAPHTAACGGAGEWSLTRHTVDSREEAKVEGTLGSAQSGFCSGRMGGPSVFVQGPAAACLPGLQSLRRCLGKLSALWAFIAFPGSSSFKIFLASYYSHLKD